MAVGTSALVTNTTGSYNAAIGASSLGNNISGGYNVSIGYLAMVNSATGANNSSLGYLSGAYLSNGTTDNATPQNSVFIGANTRSLTNNDTNQIVIGYNAIGKGSNTVQLGNSSVTATYLQGEVNINPIAGQISRAIINSDNNVGALLSFRTANLPRWAIRKDGNETGSNVGGDLSVRRYNDAGAFIDNPISIKRSTGAVTLNSAYALPTVAPTSGQVLGYLGAGTTQWTTPSSSSGIWGIANSSGVYTYYATWALAVASAVSGQCIELFADITESAVSYTLKNGVNINGNGHTISFSVVDGFIATSSPTICEINNIVVNQATASVSGLYINANGSIIGGNATFNSNNASSNGVYGRSVSRIYGFKCNGYNAIYASGFFSPNAVIDNVYVESLGGSVTAGTLSNSIIKTSSAGVVPVGDCGTVNNCYIYSNGGSAIVATGTMEVNNCAIVSVTSRAVNGNGITFNNCWIKSSANAVAGNGKFNNCALIASTTAINTYLGGGLFNNCTITANASAVFDSAGSSTIVNNCNVICNYNNAGGYGFTGSACYVNNSVIQLSNASSTAFFSSGALTMYLANNSIKGTTNFKNVNVTNGQTNVADLQGNVILQ
jgi:hypothetical protein